MPYRKTTVACLGEAWSDGVVATEFGETKASRLADREWDKALSFANRFDASEMLSLSHCRALARFTGVQQPIDETLSAHTSSMKWDVLVPRLEAVERVPYRQKLGVRVSVSAE